MYCKTCGKEIDDNAYVCPHCGVKTNVVTEKKTNTLAIVGFVLSFFFAIAGLICCIIARRQIKESAEGGAGLALAGLIISIVEMAVAAIYIIAVVAMVAGALGSIMQ